MRRMILRRLAAAAPALALSLAVPAALRAEEQPVAPYVQSNANAGAAPIRDPRLWRAFHGLEGVARIVDQTIAANVADPRTAEIFKATDMERLHRTLKEQLCYLLGGPCDYTGRSMKDAHRDQGLQQTDFNIMVEHLQEAMRAEGVSFRDQNRLLAKLAPMQRDVVRR
jgi:hemoglobin